MAASTPWLGVLCFRPSLEGCFLHFFQTLHHAHIEEHISHIVLPMYSQATAGYGWLPFVNTVMTRPSKAPLTGAQSITMFE